MAIDIGRGNVKTVDLSPIMHRKLIACIAKNRNQDNKNILYKLPVGNDFSLEILLILINIIIFVKHCSFNLKKISL